MKKAIKNWLFKEELQSINDLKEKHKCNLESITNLADTLHSQFPTHDAVSDMMENSLIELNYITESEVEDMFSDHEYITETDLYYKLEDYIEEDSASDIIESSIDTVLPDAIHAGIQEFFKEHGEDLIKKHVKELPGYFMYEQTKRYVEEDYVKWDHFKQEFDDLSVKIQEINEIIEHLEAFQAPGVDKVIFFANFKDAIRKLLDETNILPSDE